MKKLIVSLIIFLSLCLPSFAITKKEAKKLVGENVIVSQDSVTYYRGRMICLFDMDYPKEKVWYVVILEETGIIRAFEIKDNLIVRRYGGKIGE